MTFRNYTLKVKIIGRRRLVRGQLILYQRTSLAV
jgi:hypothetical protein